MKTLKEFIVEALKESQECIQLTYLSKSCEPELSVDYEAMAENVKAVVKAHIEKCKRPIPNKELYIDTFNEDCQERCQVIGMNEYRKALMESLE